MFVHSSHIFLADFWLIRKITTSQRPRERTKNQFRTKRYSVHNDIKQRKTRTHLIWNLTVMIMFDVLHYFCLKIIEMINK